MGVLAGNTLVVSAQCLFCPQAQSLFLKCHQVWCGSTFALVQLRKERRCEKVSGVKVCGARSRGASPAAGTIRWTMLL